MTNRSDRPAYPDILSTVSTSPIIDFFLYLFADWDLLNLLELSQELILLLWSIPDTFFDPRNRRERFKGLALFFLPNHSFMNSHEEVKKKSRKIYSIFWCFLFKAFLTDVLTPLLNAIKMYLSNHSFMKVLFKEILKEFWTSLKISISAGNGPFFHAGSRLICYITILLTVHSFFRYSWTK